MDIVRFTRPKQLIPCFRIDDGQSSCIYCLRYFGYILATATLSKVTKLLRKKVLEMVYR